MKLHKYTLPQFDLSEIEVDNDIQFKNYQPLKPLHNGDFISEFNISAEFKRWGRFFNGGETHGPILINQFADRPIVIAFYSKQWQEYGIDLLIQLNAIQSQIKAKGGNLLIISPYNECNLNKLAWNNNLSLSFYFDENNKIANLFKIYSDHDPTWNHFSGVETNVPLLSTFVLDANKQIVFGHIERNFQDTISSKVILSAVNRANTSIQKKSA